MQRSLAEKTGLSCGKEKKQVFFGTNAALFGRKDRALLRKDRAIS